MYIRSENPGAVIKLRSSEWGGKYDHTWTWSNIWTQPTCDSCEIAADVKCASNTQTWNWNSWEKKHNDWSGYSKKYQNKKYSWGKKQKGVKYDDDSWSSGSSKY